MGWRRFEDGSGRLVLVVENAPSPLQRKIVVVVRFLKAWTGGGDFILMMGSEQPIRSENEFSLSCHSSATTLLATSCMWLTIFNAASTLCFLLFPPSCSSGDTPFWNAHTCDDGILLLFVTFAVEDCNDVGDDIYVDNDEGADDDGFLPSLLL